MAYSMLLLALPGLLAALAAASPCTFIHNVDFCEQSATLPLPLPPPLRLLRTPVLSPPRHTERPCKQYAAQRLSLLRLLH